MDDSTQAKIAELLAKLPEPVRRAITAGNVEKEMRALAEKHRLHVDQWDKLEEEVLMALFGIRPIAQLQKNIQQDVGVTDNVALALTEDIMRIVFAPIREELERELGHPTAKQEELSDIDKVREQVLAEASEQKTVSSEQQTEATQLGQQAAPTALLPKPATPPPPAPSEKVIRAPASGAYKPGETSVGRADVHDDPYREPPQ